MRAALLSVLLGCSCVHEGKQPFPDASAEEARCETACGLSMAGTPAECRELARAEARTLAQFNRHVQDFSYTAGCLSLDGWTVSRRKFTQEDLLHCPLDSWRDEETGTCLSGWTETKRREVTVTGDLSMGSLPHELGHVMLGLGHCRWRERGVKRALLAITGQADATSSNCD